jgi:hypothetical protein
MATPMITTGIHIPIILSIIGRELSQWLKANHNPDFSIF